MDAYSQKDLFAVERLANSLSLSDPSRNLFEGVLASVRLQTDQANLALKRFLEISSAERQLKEVALFFLSENEMRAGAYNDAAIHLEELKITPNK
jgi:hypothetical protein